MDPQKTEKPPQSGPWWKHGYMWMVVGGPLIVVVAGFTTLWLAVRTPDPVIAEDYYRRGIEINERLQESEKSLVPALKGRNHAATPAQDQPRSPLRVFCSAAQPRRQDRCGANA